ncbi:MAG: hypothetical protein OEU36_21620 [Gammaproteobacteria bacterium]|jgi:hypothetical protein|nr:hypothetical protein [Gammaproteobacteria bacterium]
MALEPVVLFLVAVSVIALPAAVLALFGSALFPERRFTVTGLSVVIVLGGLWGALALAPYFDRLLLLWWVPRGLGLPYGREALDFLLAVFLVWAMLAMVLGVALDWDRRERRRRSRHGPR